MSEIFSIQGNGCRWHTVDSLGIIWPCALRAILLSGLQSRRRSYWYDQLAGLSVYQMSASASRNDA